MILKTTFDKIDALPPIVEEHKEHTGCESISVETVALGKKLAERLFSVITNIGYEWRDAHVTTVGGGDVSLEFYGDGKILSFDVYPNGEVTGLYSWLNNGRFTMEDIENPSDEEILVYWTRNYAP